MIIHTKVVADKTDATSKDEKTIQCPDLGVLICFFWGESAAVSQKINEAHSDATVHIQD